VAKEDTTSTRKRSAASTANAVRARLAQLVWLVCVLCALALASGALLVALKANTDNALVNWGLGAVAWLVIGRILDRIIRP